MSTICDEFRRQVIHRLIVFHIFCKFNYLILVLFIDRLGFNFLTFQGEMSFFSLLDKHIFPYFFHSGQIILLIGSQFLDVRRDIILGCFLFGQSFQTGEYGLTFWLSVSISQTIFCLLCHFKCVNNNFVLLFFIMKKWMNYISIWFNSSRCDIFHGWGLDYFYLERNLVKFDKVKKLFNFLRLHQEPGWNNPQDKTK